MDKVVETVFYVSTAGLNLTEDLDINVDNDILIALIHRRTRYAIIDLYNMKLIGEYKHENQQRENSTDYNW